MGPDINMVLEENVTYVCFNFYGTGLGFTTSCGTDAYNERCYKKECLDVTTTTTTCARGGLEFIDNGCCRFDGFGKTTAKYRGAQAEGDCLAMCNNDPTCIAADVRCPDINLVLEENVTYVCFNFYGTGDGFTTHCRTD